jgi:hypothetical protein
MVQMGARISIADMAERLGIKLADETEEVLVPAPTAQPGAAAANALPTRAQMARFVGSARSQIGAALGNDLGPVLDRAAAVGAMTDPAAQRTAALALLGDLPGELVRAIERGPAAAAAFANAYGTAFLNGAASVAKPENPKLALTADPAAERAKTRVSEPGAL